MSDIPTDEGLEALLAPWKQLIHSEYDGTIYLEHRLGVVDEVVAALRKREEAARIEEWQPFLGSDDEFLVQLAEERIASLKSGESR